MPQSLAVTRTGVKVPERLRTALNNLDVWSSQIVIIIFEYLKGDKSVWHPYFQLLPETFDTLMFWTSSELSELKGSDVLNKIGKETAEESWDATIIPVMQSNQEYFPVPFTSFQDHRDRLIKLAHFAGSLIMAYAFDIDEDDLNRAEGSNDDGESPEGSDLTEDDEDDPAKGLIPFADMLNADADRRNARLYQEDGLFTIRTTKKVKQGEEILNDYGSLPRCDMLRRYGYITDNYSRYDVVEIPVSLVLDVAESSGLDRSYLIGSVCTKHCNV